MRILFSHCGTATRGSRPLDTWDREPGAAQWDCAKERSVVLLHVGARPVGRRGGFQIAGTCAARAGRQTGTWAATKRIANPDSGVASPCFRGRILAWCVRTALLSHVAARAGREDIPAGSRGNVPDADRIGGAERAATQETPERRGTAARHDLNRLGLVPGAGRRSGRGGCASSMKAASARRGRR